MDHRQQYNWSAGCQISDLYEYEHDFTSKKYSTLFRFDEKCLQGGGLASIVYKYINKEYIRFPAYGWAYWRNFIWRWVY